MLQKPLLILTLIAGTTCAMTCPLPALALGTAFPPPVLHGSTIPLILVQDTGGSGGNSNGGDSTHEAPDNTPPDAVDPTDDAVDITDEETASVVDDLKSGSHFCRSDIDRIYRVDCLSDQYKAAAKSLPARGGYAAARKALLDASAQLQALAAANADKGKPAIKVTSGKTHTHRPLTPVANAAAVNAKAAEIISATKIVLLRSAEGSKERRAAYTAIAAGV